MRQSLSTGVVAGPTRAGGTHDDRPRGSGARQHPQPHPGPDRPAAVVPVPHPDGRRPRASPGSSTGWRSPSPAPSSPTLTEADTLALSSTAAGLIATVYLVGEVVGALFFGRLSDKLGPQEAVHHHPGRLPGRQRADRAHARQRRRLDRSSSTLTRFIAGMGIGGEYAAINSAIDELIPARYRGRVDIAVNGTYWAGAIIGTLGTFIFLNQLEPEHRLAGRLPARPGARPGDHLRPPAPAGEPALAGHARPRGARPRRPSPTSSTRSSRAAARCRRSTRPRRSRSSRPRTSATSPWPGCCSRSTRAGRSTAPR